MGKDVMMSASKKLAVVTIISTETEIVADGESSPKYSWFKHFRLAQCNSTKEGTLA